MPQQYNSPKTPLDYHWPSANMVPQNQADSRKDEPNRNIRYLQGKISSLDLDNNSKNTLCTGRWTDDEHMRFLFALNAYGKPIVHSLNLQNIIRRWITHL
jgi:hypothetical protein